MKKKVQISHLLWDLWCSLSLVGIWPRFIEPNCLKTKKIKLPIPNLPKALDQLKILHLSDLHLNEGMTNYFLKKILKKIKQLNPDILVFTGDFLCYSQISQCGRFEKFIHSLPKARYGNYAVFGNHDYAHYACINKEGEYDIQDKKSSKPTVVKGFERLFKTISIKKKHTEKALKTPMNKKLVDIIDRSHFDLLHNETKTLSIKEAKLNITGLGEYMLGQMNPKAGFANYEDTSPGIALVHNPDSVPHLKDYPGNLILCGHTHGGQVNLPFMSNKFVLIENMHYKKGLIKENDRWIHVSCGLGGVMNFRWFCPPEMTLLELTDAE